MARAIVQALEEQFLADDGGASCPEHRSDANNEVNALDGDLDAEIGAEDVQEEQERQDDLQANADPGGFEFIHEESGSDVEVKDSLSKGELSYFASSSTPS